MDNDKILKLIYDLEFTKYEAKLLVLVISQLDENDKESKKYLIPVTKIYNNFKNIDYLKLKIFIRIFLSKSMIIELDKENFLITTIISNIEYKNNMFEVMIPKKSFQYLLKIKNNFKSYEFENLIKLGDNNSIKIYQLVKKFEKIGSGVVPLVEIQDRLELEKSFLVYSHFKKKILIYVIEKITKLTDINLDFKEIKTGKKVTDIYFLVEQKSKIEKDDIFLSSKIEDKQIAKQELNIMVAEIVNENHLKKDITPKKEKLEITKDTQDDISRVVRMFDQERKKLQRNYVRNEYRHMDGAYLLRMHIAETGRTPKMFFDAIRWLFSKNPKAEFHRQYIMNIGKLIEHFNTLEHQSMYSKEAIEFTEEAQILIRVLKKRGASEDEIKSELIKGGFIDV